MVMVGGARAPIRCPLCTAVLGEIRDGVVVVDLRTGHGAGFRRTILGAVEIRCGKPRKGGGTCSGVWQASG